MKVQKKGLLLPDDCQKVCKALLLHFSNLKMHHTLSLENKDLERYIQRNGFFQQPFYDSSWLQTNPPYFQDLFQRSSKHNYHFQPQQSSSLNIPTLSYPTSSVIHTEFLPTHQLSSNNSHYPTPSLLVLPAVLPLKQPEALIPEATAQPSLSSFGGSKSTKTKRSSSSSSTQQSSSTNEKEKKPKQPRLSAAALERRK